MESFLSELGTKKVISKDDIVLLKQYIQKKHNSRSKAEKSKILTDSIHKILDRSIDGIAPDYVHSIKQQLLNQVITGENKILYMADIFNICISSSLDSKEFLESIKDWVNLNVENQITSDEIEHYMRKSEMYVTKNIRNTEEQQIIAAEEYNEYIIKTDNKAEVLIQNTLADKSNEVLPLAEIRIADCEAAMNYADQINFFKKIRYILENNKRVVIAVLALSLVITISFASIVAVHSSKRKANTLALIKNEKNVSKSEKAVNASVSKTSMLALTSNLPHNFLYKETNLVKLKKYLAHRKSLLAQEPYFSTIIKVARDYNLNPHILFAVTGQEQGFVPQNKRNAKKIVNNPFNVYISWKKYNTNIKDSTKIACITIINMCRNRPNEAEAFKWINKNYAEDSNWHKGVRSIFDKLEKYCSTK